MLARIRREREPFRGIMSIQDEMNRLFRDYLDDDRPAGFSEFTPSVDVSENGDTFIIKADLPGMSDKDVEVSVIGDLITIKGERTEEHADENENFYRKERRVGTFMRQMRLPAHIDSNNVKATFKNGVLTVSLPKSEQEKQKKISITPE